MRRLLSLLLLLVIAYSCDLTDSKDVRKGAAKVDSTQLLLKPFAQFDSLNRLEYSRDVTFDSVTGKLKYWQHKYYFYDALNRCALIEWKTLDTNNSLVERRVIRYFFLNDSTLSGMSEATYRGKAVVDSFMESYRYERGLEAEVRRYNSKGVVVLSIDRLVTPDGWISREVTSDYDEMGNAINVRTLHFDKKGAIIEN